MPACPRHRGPSDSSAVQPLLPEQDVHRGANDTREGWDWASRSDRAPPSPVQQRLVQHHLRAEVLTGRQHHSFRFDRKLRGALGHTPKELQEFVATGFGRLDAGEFGPANELAGYHDAVPLQGRQLAS